MEKQALSTRYRVFLIKFKAIQERFIIDYNEGSLGDVISRVNKHGIEYIKEFDSAKDSFKRLSKKRVIATFDHDTHTIIELQKTGFIK